VLASINRSTVYASHLIAGVDEQELVLLVEIDAEYTRHPFYGSRKMVVHLRGLGHPVNRKRVQRMMRLLGLAGMAPGPNTSRPHPQHKVYPYLLRGVIVTRPNQVWSTDITYIRLARGFAYLVAVIRLVLSQSAGMAVIEHSRRWFLCRLPGTVAESIWHPRDI
jgi:putative transposase